MVIDETNVHVDIIHNIIIYFTDVLLDTMNTISFPYGTMLFTIHSIRVLDRLTIDRN